jgi:hypothetical protein
LAPVASSQHVKRDSQRGKQEDTPITQQRVDIGGAM